MSEFILYPAIDIRDGKAVRLLRGDYQAMTVYHDHPAEVAQNFVKQGAQFLHVVDLDGAKDGSLRNREAIAEIVRSVPIPVQVGGGIRNGETLESLFRLGVARCILGTAAVEQPDFVREALQKYGEKIAIGIDARDGRVAVKGWLETADILAVDLGKQLKEWGATRVIFTDIARDGTLTGPNLPAIVRMAEETGLGVIASGGVKEIADVQALAAHRAQGVAGAIIGKALYAGKVDLSQALAAVAGQTP